MRVLILGNGGRENALYYKIKNSSLVTNVYVTPFNGGVDKEDQVNLDILNFEEVIQFINDKFIQLVVVGPELPLVKGIKDILAQRVPQVLVFGPNSFGAQLEGSKVFSTEYMIKNNIPTAKSHICLSLDAAIKVIENHSLPIVIKVDGLAAGKGVSIHEDIKSARSKIEDIFINKTFGEAGNKVLIQEFMTGIEASLFAICNGKDAVYLPTAQDYKRVFDNNQGPNTGGMGSYCPANNLTPEQINFVHTNITKKILADFSYSGLLYIGLMIHSTQDSDVSVVEFNCRFGDPETQSILPMLETDIVPYLLWSAGDNNILLPLIQTQGYNYIPYKPGVCINVVVSSKGYPSDYEKNIEFILPDLIEDVHIVHAGTTHIENNTYISTGGRVFSVVGYGNDIMETRQKVYNYIDLLSKKNKNFLKFHCRKDIAL